MSVEVETWSQQMTAVAEADNGFFIVDPKLTMKTVSQVVFIDHGESVVHQVYALMTIAPNMHVEYDTDVARAVRGKEGKASLSWSADALTLANQY